jgi:hypothetical protein
MSTTQESSAFQSFLVGLVFVVLAVGAEWVRFSSDNPSFASAIAVWALLLAGLLLLGLAVVITGVRIALDEREEAAARTSKRPPSGRRDQPDDGTS